MVYRGNELVSKVLVFYMGGGSLFGSLAGWITSSYVSSRTLSAIFSGLLLAGVLLMLLPQQGFDLSGGIDEQEFNRVVAFLIALMVGVIGGSEYLHDRSNERQRVEHLWSGQHQIRYRLQYARRTE